MRIRSNCIFILILLCTTVIFYGCSNTSKKEIKYFTTKDATEVFNENRQTFYNVQNVFKVENINNDFNFFTKDNYQNNNANDEQLKALTEIFNIPEVKSVSFKIYADSNMNNEITYAIYFYLKRSGCDSSITIVYHPINSINILKTRPDTHLGNQWFIFKPTLGI